MKVAELMVGDWLIDPHKNTPVKIDPFLVMGLEIPYEPIPLTAEILEKNGFSKKSLKAFRYLDEDTRVEMDFYLGNGLFNVTKHLYLEDEVTYSLPEPCFVHELQHTLRLCGLNDLADNFKIN